MIVACFYQIVVALYIVAARTWLLGAGMSDRRESEILNVRER